MPCERSRRMRCASSASCVVTMPPSAVVMILTAWKLNTVDVGELAFPSAGRGSSPRWRALASCRILKPCRSASVRISRRSQGRPEKSHRDHDVWQRPARRRAPRALLPTPRRTCSGLPDRCRRSRSSHRNRARSWPRRGSCSGWSRRAIPGPTPSARQAMCSPAVALFTAMACATCWRAANASSKAGTCGPWVRKSERSTSQTAAMSASETSWRP